jgi:DNA-directed RNA polymerase subunit beta'
MILGVYYLTTERKGMAGEGTIFATTDEVIRAYALGEVHPHSIIGISTHNFAQKKMPHDGILVTTVGKVILNHTLPEDMIYLNTAESIGTLSEEDIVAPGKDVRAFIKTYKTRKSFTKKALQQIISLLYNQYPIDIVPRVMDGIKDLGFHYSMRSATTVSAYDIPQYSKKNEYFKQADEQVNKLKYQYQKGLLTDDERYKKVVEL